MIVATTHQKTIEMIKDNGRIWCAICNKFVSGVAMRGNKKVGWICFSHTQKQIDEFKVVKKRKK